MTFHFHLLLNKCTIHIDQPREAFCRALAKAHLLPATTITNNFSSITFYANKVETLQQVLTQHKGQLQYNHAMLMAKFLGQQLFYLHKYAYTFAWFDVENILVIDDAKFVYLGVDQLYPINTLSQIRINTPFSRRLLFLSPEMKQIRTLPSLIDYRTSYYSLGALISYCLVDIDEKTIKESLASLIYTKLYWFLLRSIERQPSRRSLLFI